MKASTMKTSSVPREAINIYNHDLELSNKGDLDSAITEYRKAINIYPSFVEAYNNIGEIYSRLGRKESAISIYLDAMNIEKHYRVLLNLGVEYYHNKDFPAALRFFKEALAAKPDFIEGNFYTGMVYYDQKDYPAAKDFFTRVIMSDRKHLKANYLLSYIHYEWKEYEKTIEYLDIIRDIADNPSFINKYYGFCYYYLGDYRKAVNFLSTALEASPKYSQFKDYLVSLTYENKLKEIGDIDQAISGLENKMLTSQLEFKEATRLGMLYIFKGKNDKAEKLLMSLKQKLAS